ncbi:MAG TPA: hypothetical protein VGS11_00150 [Candidatus Bathyarchaeia archaeon]|nr:hypothetical protein [Candidatus Bathyarchaeia archaeon]
MGIGIEKLAIEIEETANGVYPSDRPQRELLVSKARKIQQLSRRRRSGVAERVDALICHKCDLPMTFSEATGKYRVFSSGNCGNRVGVL